MELITTIVPALVANFPDDADRSVITAVEWNNRFDLLTTQGNLSQEILKDIIDTANLHLADTNNPHDVTKAQLYLENVNNTSDADKPISTAAQTALDNKVDKIEGKGLVKVVQLGGLSTSDVMSQKAIVDYVATLGGGDMMKEIYDPDDLGAEAFAMKADLLTFEESTQAAFDAIQTQIDNSIAPVSERIDDLEAEMATILTTATYSDLTTTSKTVIAAVNELHTDVDNRLAKSSASTVTCAEIAFVTVAPSLATQQANPTRLYMVLG